jgi:hypothetical protein
MTSHLLFRDFIVCVPESQAKEYEGVVGASKVVAHSDSIVGLTRKWNWMLDNLNDGECIVAFDDDLTHMSRMFVDKNEERIIRDPDLIQEIVYDTYVMAADMGAWMFGWSTTEATIMYYSGQDPFSLKGFINGCAVGYTADCPIRSDERIVGKTDYDDCLMNAYLKRYLFRNDRYAFGQPNTFKGEGGQDLHRTSETEKQDVEILRKKWGPCIQVGIKGGKRKRDYAGAMKVSLSLPY